jgi:N-methylhydantoinase A/oxoprolinase/acetone carboxylase beta subunit
MRIGIDVGGTNTDAVVLDGRRIVAWKKCPTTDDISRGIVDAIAGVMVDAEVGAADIDAVMIGTTHFTNAVVERRHLLPVGILRVALPATMGLPPLVGWPSDIKAAVHGATALIGGLTQYNGRVDCPLDEKAVRAAAQDFRRRGLTSVAVSATFSPVSSTMEVRSEEILREEMPGVRITISSRIGRLGLLERENATILNASLGALAGEVVASFRRALSTLHITAPFFVSQNDGTLMSAEAVEQFPVLTFASGPTNSMRGAAYLCGLKDALVVDIGGTTSDIGVLVNGFPREASVATDVGGVRTNFRMPDVLAVGLGGGSHVLLEACGVKIGPQSVGFRIREQALVFGGGTLTATDIAVAAGYADIGDRAAVAALSPKLVDAAVDRIHRLIEGGVDRVKTSAAALPLILVGGGSILVSRPISGASDVIVPEHAGVANAIGAAIAQIGGEIDHVYHYGKSGREQALSDARKEASRAAVAAGADPATVEIVDLEESPLAYVPGGAVRVRAKAVGTLSIGRSASKKTERPCVS